MLDWMNHKITGINRLSARAELIGFPCIAEALDGQRSATPYFKLLKIFGTIFGTATGFKMDEMTDLRHFTQGVKFCII